MSRAMVRRSYLGRPESDFGRLAKLSHLALGLRNSRRFRVKLINRPDQPATGAGETAITIVAAAIGNAIFDATGARIRQVPFTPGARESGAKPSGNSGMPSIIRCGLLTRDS